jgi:hypothetical protein
MTDSSFGTPSTSNRWLIVAAAVIVQLALGFRSTHGASS